MPSDVMLKPYLLAELALALRDIGEMIFCPQKSPLFLNAIIPLYIRYCEGLLCTEFMPTSPSFI
jgi:hypothetical protein